MKALHHILKNPGQNIKLCKGNIPFQKKQQYKALYNLGIIKKRDRQGRSKEMREEIDEYQDRTLAAHFLAITVPTAASLVHKGHPEEMNSSQSTMLLSITSTPRHSPSFASLSKPKTLTLDKGQLTLFGITILINATNACHIAIASFIHSNALPFSLSECPKLLKIIEVSRNLGPGYMPPDC
jgi:hypothetical protein